MQNTKCEKDIKAHFLFFSHTEPEINLPSFTLQIYRRVCSHIKTGFFFLAADNNLGFF